MFELHIRTDNAAFDDDEAGQVAETLRVIAGMVEAGHTDGPIRDPNGNTIGRYRFAPDGDRES